MDIVNQINIEQLLLAALTLTSAGVIGFWVKDIPVRLWEHIKRQCTTTLDITSAHNSFYNLMRFIEENYSGKNFRTFKLTNGKWGDNEITTIGIGYGGHFIKFERIFMHLNLTRNDSQGTSIDKETITITKLGRSRKEFEKFFRVISTDKEREKSLQIYRMDDYWYPMNQIPKRAMDTVFLENDKKRAILDTIDNFIKEEQWYLDNGIPYHLGILLYGKPGTGKSSLIKSIASHINYDIYYLPVSSLIKIENCMSTLPAKSIIVIEDIDCEKALHNRSNDEDSEERTKTIKQTSDTNNKNDSFSMINFSDVLNAIDGICSSHGRILLTTTNHIEKLDPALIRPGRIDLKIEVGYATTEIFNQFSRRFFNKEIDHGTKLKERLTCAELQNLLLQKKSFEDILKYAEYEMERHEYLKRIS